MSRGDPAEAEGRVLKGLLPVAASNRGRARRPEASQSIINGMLWRLRRGTPWRDVLPEYGNWTRSAGDGARPESGRQYRPRWPRSWQATGARRRSPGRSRGGFACKLHCLADGQGRPPAFHLTAGEAVDCKARDTLIALPERAPRTLLADKGCDADAIRADLANRNIEAVIPGRSNRKLKSSVTGRPANSATGPNASSAA